MLLNEALKLMRVYHHMTQQDVASKLKVGKSYISELEAGNRTPSLEILDLYAKAFSIPLSSLLFFAENIENSSNSGKIRKYVASEIIKLLRTIAKKSNSEKIDA